jgi:hypothetical protein
MPDQQRNMSEIMKERSETLLRNPLAQDVRAVPGSL